MPSTLRFGIQYPAGSAVPNVPLSMQTQAESVESALNNNFPYKIASGTGTISIGSAVSFATLVVNLPAGFTATPAVTASMTTATAGRASLLNMVVTGSTATSFTVRIYTSDNANTGTSYTIGFNWIAVQQTA